MGSLFFMIAALTRKIFIVYLQGVAIFMLYIIGLTVFSATRSLEHFWSGILDPVGFILFDDITRYWTVIEKNTLLLSWDFSGFFAGVFLYNRLLWTAVVCSPWAACGLSSRCPSKPLRHAARENAPPKRAAGSGRGPARSVLGCSPLPRVHQMFPAATVFAQYRSLTRLRIATFSATFPSGRSSRC
jgi:ABC-2 type transport system permease protein